MRVLVVHIGDLHSTKDGNPSFARKQSQMFPAIMQAIGTFDECVLLNTGDIAMSGTEKEFQAGIKLLKPLTDSLKSATKSGKLQEIHLPGNHDCFLPSAQYSERKQFVKSISSNINYMKDGHPLLQPSLSHLEEFFKFEAQRGQRKKREGLKRLVDHFTLEFDGKSLLFTWLNTAWLSQHTEMPGELDIMYDDDFSQLYGLDPALHFVMMHHPPSWLKPDTQRRLTAGLLRTAHILVTGHEHDLRATQISSPTSGNSYIHFDGGVLSDSNTDDSTFECLLWDTAEESLQHVVFAYSDNLYRKHSQIDISKLLRDKKNRLILHTDEHSRFLNELELPLLHSRKQELSLQDVFIWPDLEVEKFDKDTAREQSLELISSKELLVADGYQPIRFLVGGDKSGKTSLCKMIASAEYEAGRSVIVLRADEIVQSDINNINRLLNEKAKEQYVDRSIDHVMQANAESRVVIIDDWNTIKLSSKRRCQFLQNMQACVGTIYITNLDDAHYTWYLEDAECGLLKASTTVFYIKELGRKLKGKLIQKWQMIGREHEYDLDQIGRETDRIIDHVVDVIGRHLLPHYPFYILSILSIIDSKTDQGDAQFGVYGYHCEMLVQRLLQEVSKQMASKRKPVRADTLIIVYGYLSHYLYESNKDELDDVAVYNTVQRYNDEYGMSVSAGDLIDASLISGIMRRRTSDSFGFSYPFLRYYFTAKILSQFLISDEFRESAKATLSKLIQNLNAESNATIVVQVVYFTKSEWVVKQVLEVASGVFLSVKPIDLVIDTENLMKEVKLGTLSLNSSKSYSEKRDDAATEEDVADFKPNTQVEDGSAIENEASEVAQFILAGRLVQVLGQIVRNFPGSLPKSLKGSILSLGTELALRSMKTLIDIFEENKDGLIEELDKSITWLKNERRVERVIEADKLYTYIVVRECLISVLRVIRAFGSEELRDSYRDMQIDTGEETLDLISVGIRLFHFEKFPAATIVEMADKWDKRTFPYFMLRLMTWNYMYLYPIDRKDRQKVCAKLDFRETDALIATRSTDVQG